MKMRMLTFIDRPTPIHKMTGASKLICFLLWSIIGMSTYDTWVLIFMLVTGLAVFAVSRIKFQEISFVLIFILIFLLLNDLAIYGFSPEQGVQIYGTRHVILRLPGSYSLTLEQLFYELNISLKYFSMIPFALLFIVTTQPSEFAASLNKIGVSYRISYAVAITLRYIPDIQRDYQEIAQAQQARGIDLSKKARIGIRIKNAAAIVLPLIFSSLGRIETISNGMELRGFGKKKMRTWYSARTFAKRDYLGIAFSAAVLVLSLTIMLVRGSRYYNPFQ
ncbi:energy-coupling factor transporter transmembrane protein EcfT [Sporolactobacillus shoreae]|uniref:Energy-coupling factor transporter transmembrane protein EcfT n=1 Tax=Sporolactobacillus shoreae TaxID=1465501 RepID=A0A4Z0GKM6_9BACL|nr:energy-coupling factor transporter transmembrane component T [Sporolactobacillus shoreae]TGA97500.1 energy-coupling factor transporter transmembrane protein EcfT [Sporolactobacillus shoreae]